MSTTGLGSTVLHVLYAKQRSKLQKVFYGVSVAKLESKFAVPKQQIILNNKLI